MGFMVSPGVSVVERDLSTYIPAMATSVAAYVGSAKSGPVWQRVLTTSERNYADTFGTPNETTYEDFFTCSSFLSYGNSLYFTRVVDKSTAKNTKLSCYSGITAPVSGTGDYVEYIVLVSTADIESKTDTVEGTYSVEEVFKVSTISSKVDSFGNNMYIDEILNKSSKYIMSFHNTAVTSELAALIAESPAGGGNGAARSPGDISLGYDLYRNPEEIDVNIIIGGANTTASIALNIDDICESRKDCIGVLNVQKSEVVLVASAATALTNVTTYRKTTLNINSSYSALYGNWFKINDKYNDKKRWIPSSGAVAGIFAYTDFVTDPWFAPAGLNRGILRNLLELAIH